MTDVGNSQRGIEVGAGLRVPIRTSLTLARCPTINRLAALSCAYIRDVYTAIDSQQAASHPAGRFDSVRKRKQPCKFFTWWVRGPIL